MPMRKGSGQRPGPNRFGVSVVDGPRRGGRRVGGGGLDLDTTGLRGPGFRKRHGEQTALEMRRDLVAID